jgi:mRNA interferase MazF
VLVALITRTVRDIPTEVPLDAGDGMPAACVVALDNLTTVPKVLLTERITTLDGARMHQVCTALAIATDCRA